MRSLLSALAWVIVALVANIGAASAQEPGRVYRIVSLRTGSPGLVVPPVEKWTGPGAAYRDGLRDRGYVVGKNAIIEVRHGEGDLARLATVAEALAASKPDVIVSAGTAATVAAMQATKTIPIVFTGLGGPVEKGIVASLAKPGGNVTGNTTSTSNPKMWQLLRDTSPATRRAGYVIYGPNNFRSKSGSEYRTYLLSKSRRDAAAVGIELVDMIVDTRDELEGKLAELASLGDAALFIVTDPVEWGAEGCLATYGEDPYEQRRNTVGQIDKVLRGVKPADIPVEEPSKFKLIINAKTAKALDLTVPPSLLVLADEVIE